VEPPTRTPANSLLFHVRILENLFDGLHRLPEEIHDDCSNLAQVRVSKKSLPFKTFDLDASALLAGKSSLGFLNLYPAHEGSSRHRCRSSAYTV
jgi:hypothetical protein